MDTAIDSKLANEPIDEDMIEGVDDWGRIGDAAGVDYGTNNTEMTRQRYGIHSAR